MAENRTPMVAGLGGVALAVALFSGAGQVPSTTDEPKIPASATVEKSAQSAEVTDNQNGPWYAFCREYVPLNDKQLNQDLGVKEYRIPDADEGVTEFTRQLNAKESEKFTVKVRPLGDLHPCVPPGATMRILMATVPDPNMTEMRLDFDRDIQAIQSAAAQQKYNYTGYWFPWRAPNWSPEKGADAETEIHRRDEPGILCFRNDNPKSKERDQRLFVFLVGETPTSGVNRIQLDHALGYWRQLRGDLAQTDRTRLGVSGPHFSASFPVLKEVLNNTLYDTYGTLAPTVDLVSPDASGNTFIKNFRSYCDHEVRRLGAPPCSLRTLSLSSDDAMSTALTYLGTIGYADKNRIAHLIEDESVFGSSIETDSDQEQSRAASRYNKTLHLRFPRDLSALRNLSDKESEKIAQSGSKFLSLQQAVPPTKLTADQPTQRDTPAAFATEQEAAEAARTLSDDTEEMRASRVQAVIIDATNPLDRVYLLEYLHKELPDLRMATIGADAQEVGDPHFVDLTGTIAVTALPPLTALVPVGFLGSMADDKSPVSFRSDRQEGTFLAVGTLLDPSHDSRTYRLYTAEEPPCSKIAVVERIGFRLIPFPGAASDVGTAQTFPCSSDTANGGIAPNPALETVQHQGAPKSFMAFLLFVALLNLIYILSIVNSKRGKDGVLSYVQEQVGESELRRLYLLLIVNNQLVLLDLLATRLAWAVWADWQDALQLCLPGLTLDLLMASAGWSVWLILKYRKEILRMPANQKPSFDRLVVDIFVPLVYLLWTGLMIWKLTPLQASGSAFLERLTLLGDGLSPVLPITAILFGYALWGRMQLARLNWIASRKIDLQLQDGWNSDLYHLVREIDARTYEHIPKAQIVYLIGVPSAVILACWLFGSLQGFDGGWFYWWFLIWGFSILLLLAVLTCFQAWSIWDRLRELLDWLETTPMKDAFKKIGDDDRIHIKISDLTKLERSFTILSETCKVIGSIYGANSAQAIKVKLELDKFAMADQEGNQAPREIGPLHTAMNVEMQAAVQPMLLEPVGSFRLASQEYLALRLIAFIRYALLQIVTLISFVASGYVLAVISVTFYAFAGQQRLGSLLTLSFVGLLVCIGYIMVQFQKNGMLSRLEGSNPGEASYLRVGLRLLSVGGLPLLAIATSQFPAFAQFAYSLLRPVLGALH